MNGTDMLVQGCRKKGASFTAKSPLLFFARFTRTNSTTCCVPPLFGNHPTFSHPGIGVRPPSSRFPSDPSVPPAEENAVKVESENARGGIFISRRKAASQKTKKQAPSLPPPPRPRPVPIQSSPLLWRHIWERRRGKFHPTLSSSSAPTLPPPLP